MGLGSTGRRIVVEFIGDVSKLRSGLRDGEASLQGFSGKARAAGRIAGTALAGGLALAGTAAVLATKAAAEDEAAQAQLAQQLRQAAGATDAQIASTEKWISAQSLATGVADDELRPALARLATATGDVGEAQDLLALAMDVSAGTGKSLDTVTQALAKAQNGSVSGLSRLGIATKNASGETMTLAEATQAMADKYNGAAAKAADTTAGKTRIMQVQFAELQEQIGAKLLPVMTKLAEVGLKVVSWISQNTTTVGILIAAFGSLLAITTAVGAATKAFAAIQTVIRAATVAWTAVQWLLNAALSANPIGLVIVAIAALVAGLILAYKHSETFRNIVNAAFGVIKNVVASVVGWFGKYVPQVFGAVKDAITTYLNAYKAVISAVWGAIVGAVRAVLGVYRSVIVSAFNGIRDYFGNVVAAWKMIFNNAWDAIKAGFQRAKDTFVTVAGNIRDAVSGAFNGIKSAIDSVIDRVQWLINKIGELISKIKSIPKPDFPGVDIPGLRTSGRGGKAAVAAAAGVAGAVGAAAGIAGRGSAGGGSDAPIVINIYGGLDTADAIGKRVEQVLRKRERNTGRQLLVTRA